MTTCSRRRFLWCLAACTPALVACGESVTASLAESPDGVVISPGGIRIRLALVPALRDVGGSLVVAEVNVIVVSAAAGDYRAFTNVCTHAGCGIYQFTAMRLRCQCHGSEFDTAGRNVVGPAVEPLTRYPVEVVAGGTELRVALR